MSHSYSNINIHIIFHTKGDCLIQEDDLPSVFRYVGGLVRSLSGIAFIVGGRPDHIHILSTLPVTTDLSAYVRAIKANSSRWIKDLNPTYKGFSWQNGYGAFSVSESRKSFVVNYIKRQKEHHQKVSFEEEFLQFLKKNGCQQRNAE